MRQHGPPGDAAGLIPAFAIGPVSDGQLLCHTNAIARNAQRRAIPFCVKPAVHDQA
jgi:hypothetical protein